MRKLISTITALAVVLGVIGWFQLSPTISAQAATVYIQAGLPEIQVGTKENPDPTTVVAFGRYQWYVIGQEGDTLLLLEKDGAMHWLDRKSKSAYDSSPDYNSEYAYEYGDIHDLMKWYYSDIPNYMLEGEQNVINPTTIDKLPEDPTGKNNFGEGELAEQYFFPLSFDQANSVKPEILEKFNSDNDDWWLRTAVGNDKAMYVSNGVIQTAGASVEDVKAVRPAFYLDVSNVVFTSLAANVRHGGKGNQGFSEAVAPTGTLLFTFKDDNLKLEDVEFVKYDSETRRVNFNYSGATTGRYLYLSAVVVDNSNDAVLHYGQINNCTTASGSTYTTLPENFDSSKHSLKIFIEYYDEYGGSRSDFCSELKTLEVDDTVKVTDITVSGSDITTKGGTSQMKAYVEPENATDKSVTWSVEKGTGEATISATGLLTAVSDGTVTVKATAKDGSGKVGSCTINISGQLVSELPISVTGITVSGSDITTKGGTSQMTAIVEPSNATNKSVTWSVEKVTGEASISSTGLLTAVSDGTVTVKATAMDGSGVVGSRSISISGQTTETPGTETPSTETPGTETPGTETPGTETPGTETPGPKPAPSRPAVDSVAAQAASNIQLSSSKVTLANGTEVAISVSPSTKETIEQLENKAAELLTGLSMAKGVNGNVTEVVAAINIKLDLPADVPADTPVKVSFETNDLTPGNKLLAVVMYEDGTTGFAYVEMNFETGTVDVVLNGNVTSLVIIEYTPSPATDMSRLSNSEIRQVFDAEYYAMRYPDLAELYGDNARLLYQHFVTFGLAEGRAGSEEFDVSFYQLLYPDLQAVFGDDPALYLKHYLAFGKEEGRLAGAK